MSKDHVVLEEIRDPDSGLLVVITKKQKYTGYVGFSFAFFKEFERQAGSETERSTWLNDRHIGAARRLLDLAEECIQREKEKLWTQRRGAAK